MNHHQNFYPNSMKSLALSNFFHQIKIHSFCKILYNQLNSNTPSITSSLSTSRSENIQIKKEISKGKKQKEIRIRNKIKKNEKTATLVKNSHRNVLSVILRKFVNLLLKKKILFDELLIYKRFPGVEYPQNFEFFVCHKDFLKWINNFVNQYFSIYFCQELWLNNKEEVWKEKHYKAFWKELTRSFFEKDVYFFLMQESVKNSKYFHLDDYFTYIPMILRGIDNPEGFNSIKISEDESKNF